MACSDCVENKKLIEARKWQYHRILKLIILFIWLFSLFSFVFADEVENVPIFSVNYLNFDVDTSIKEGVFVSSEQDRLVGYFLVEPGYIYTVKTNSAEKNIAFSSEVPSVGVRYFDRQVMYDSFTFYGRDYSYLYFSGRPSSFTVTRVPLEGQEGAVDNVLSYITSETLWTVFSGLALPIGIFIVVFAGVYYLKKYLRSGSVGRV